MGMYLKQRIFLILFFKLILPNKEEDQHNTEHIEHIDNNPIIKEMIICNYWLFCQF